MSQHVCPRCGARAFFWYIDEEESSYTLWLCETCHYSVSEDESREQACPSCGERCYCYMTDTNGSYRWCTHCGRIESDHQRENKETEHPPRNNNSNQ